MTAKDDKPERATETLIAEHKTKVIKVADSEDAERSVSPRAEQYSKEETDRSSYNDEADYGSSYESDSQRRDRLRMAVGTGTAAPVGLVEWSFKTALELCLLPLTILGKIFGGR